MKPKVYIETSVPSFYFETRADAAAIARRDWTKLWWDAEREHYEIYTSRAVIDELARGGYDTAKKNACLELVRLVPQLRIEPEIARIVDAYIQHKIMPANAGGDALHLALASWHKCDILLTWNCKHIANANKIPHIRHVNTLLGLYVPQLVTPLELLGIDL